MKREPGHADAGLLRRVGTDTACRSTRRAFLIGVAAWPALVMTNAVFAQPQQAPMLIGWLSVGSREAYSERYAAFKKELAALGWKEDSQFLIEERWANGRVESLQSLAYELAAKKPAIIVAVPLPAATVAAKTAPGIPIVTTGPDPVALGLAKTLARPGGMVTGVANVRGNLAEKYIELLLAAAPKIKRVGFLSDPNGTAHLQTKDAARRSVAHYGVDGRYADAGKAEEIESAISRLAKEGAQALILLSAGTLFAERRRIVTLARAHRWPLIAGDSEIAVEGALLSYGVNLVATYRRLAHYVDRILKGAKPGDLPIEQPTTFEMIVNLKTAKALGITIPQSLLVRADRVIE